MDNSGVHFVGKMKSFFITSKIVIILFLINVSCHGKLLKIPVNTTVVEGDRVILKCQTDLQLTVFWYFDGKEIFYGGKISMQYASKFIIETTSEGEYNLVIRNATKWYTGVYTCADDEGEGERSSAWLTVTDPTNADVQNAKEKPQMADVVIIVIIVAAVLIGLSIIILGIVFGLKYLKRRRQKQALTVSEDPGTHASSTVQAKIALFESLSNPSQATSPEHNSASNSSKGKNKNKDPKVKENLPNRRFDETVARKAQERPTVPSETVQKIPEQKFPAVKDHEQATEHNTYSDLKTSNPCQVSENGDPVTDANGDKEEFSETDLEEESIDVIATENKKRDSFSSLDEETSEKPTSGTVPDNTNEAEKTKLLNQVDDE